MGEDKERASLNGFHSKYTDGFYTTLIREVREIQPQKKYTGSKREVGLILRFAVEANCSRWSL
jgi:hypothetical protein